MKTWTNPTVEELEVKMTASWSYSDVGEEVDIGNGEFNGPWGTPDEDTPEPGKGPNS